MKPPFASAPVVAAGTRKWWALGASGLAVGVGRRRTGPAQARLAERYYASATRYTTSSFMLLKLSENLSDRGLAPHIYESRQEAINWLGKQTPSSSAQNQREESKDQAI